MPPVFRSEFRGFSLYQSFLQANEHPCGAEGPIYFLVMEEKSWSFWKKSHMFKKKRGGEVSPGKRGGGKRLSLRREKSV